MPNSHIWYLVTGYQLPVLKQKQCQAVVHTLKSSESTLFMKKKLLHWGGGGGLGIRTDVNGTVYLTRKYVLAQDAFYLKECGFLAARNALH